MDSRSRHSAPPQRTCIACRSTGDKRGLVRVVRIAGTDGAPSSIELDLTGKKPGRGAYICRQFECWEQALKKGRIEAALKAKLTPDSRLALNEFAIQLRDAIAV